MRKSALHTYMTIRLRVSPSSPEADGLLAAGLSRSWWRRNVSCSLTRIGNWWETKEACSPYSLAGPVSVNVCLGSWEERPRSWRYRILFIGRIRREHAAAVWRREKACLPQTSGGDHEVFRRPLLFCMETSGRAEKWIGVLRQ